MKQKLDSFTDALQFLVQKGHPAAAAALQTFAENIKAEGLSRYIESRKIIEALLAATSPNMIVEVKKPQVVSAVVSTFLSILLENEEYIVRVTLQHLPNNNSEFGKADLYTLIEITDEENEYSLIIPWN